MPGHSVLVIDDEEMIRDTLVEFFDDKGFRAIGAVHGRDALDKLEASPALPCVIILDLMMPVMDGHTFRTRQLANARFAGIPVIVLSACHGAKKSALDMNASEYLDKPLKLRELLQLVNKHCHEVHDEAHNDAH